MNYLILFLALLSFFLGAAYIRSALTAKQNTIFVLRLIYAAALVTLGFYLIGVAV